MKRGLLFVGLILLFSLLLLGMVCAQTNLSNQTNKTTNTSKTQPSLKDTSLSDAGKDIKGATSEFGNKSTYSNLTSGIKSALNKDPDLPDWAEKISRVLFGFGNINVTLSNVILMLSFALMAVFLLKGILEFTSFSNTTNYAMSIGLVIVSLVTRLYSKAVIGLYNFINGKIGVAMITMILILLVAFGLFGFITRFLRPLKLKQDINKSKQAGVESKVDKQISKMNTAAMEKVNRAFAEGI